MAPKPSPARRPRVSALALAEHGELPVHLTAPERALLGEALRRGEDLREELESTLTSYGRWILGSIFHDDAAAALDDKSKNPVWLELVRRAGGPSLRVSRRILYVAVQVAARDKRITDMAWRGLDAGTKELLLPLATDERLREAAQHVSKWNLSHSNTRKYVAEVLKSNGRSRGVRITVPRLVARAQKLRQSLDGAAVLRKVAELRDSMDHGERARAADELDRLRGVLGEVARTLRSKR